MTGDLSPEDVQRLETLFERGAGLEERERTAFLDRECGTNSLLRSELEDLFAGLAGEDLLSQLQPGAPSREGTKIGSYKLLERVGQGGMGEVYAAEQLEPVERRVAVKLIKPGMDSVEVVRRFHAERQALARMAHPNIAQVYDAGATDDGRPFFVMEFVDGVAITDACDREKLSTRQRIELFLDVCDGVQHAHQKGIIHRDLKPSNLLVTQHGESALTKIIDFGVARATTGRLGDRTLQTMLGQVVGTLDYMSPEQADPTALDIDTRSDIYSLGVVLYQLITGLLPFDSSTQAHLPLSLIQKTILEVSPPTPSSRLRQAHETAASIATLHGTDLNALVRRLSGDLDWICLKALEKDPARRYASASELAQDLRRHLAHEPVAACRPSAVYRTRKFVRRNRVSVVASVVVLGAAIGGIYGFVEAESARVEADALAKIAKAQEAQADGYEVRQLILEADELWPPHPDRIPELRSWQENAANLLARFESHEHELAALRQKALERTPEERLRDEISHPDAGLLQLMREEFEILIERLEDPEPRRQRGRPGALAEQLEQDEERALFLEPEIEALSQEVERRNTWNFATQEDSIRHDLLGDLVDGLKRVHDPSRGLVDASAASKEFGWSVPRRLEFAEELARGFGPEGTYARAWAEALPALRESYPGLDLEPQMGLVPLGSDPESELWEFAHLQSGEPAERNPEGKLIRTEQTGLVFVLIPGGTFTIGAQWSDPESPNYDPEADPALSSRCANCDEPFPRDAQVKVEGPPVEMSIEAFFLSKYEMTQQQWLRATGTNPSHYQPVMFAPSPLNPVNQIDWHECVSVLDQLGLMLPTEPQWEYAVRARTSTIWWQGNDAQALEGTVNLFGREAGSRVRGIKPVGSFPANPYGLHDMVGNVTEWCRNRPGLPGAETTPTETLGLRSARGANAREGVDAGRSAARHSSVPGLKSPLVGVRPMRAISSSKGK